jgi:hypothetical protein
VSVEVRLFRLGKFTVVSPSTDLVSVEARCLG